ncbi:MAG TPA: hypothetical protein VK928_02810 [Longimicrobiales bacterium]|nr:hypothetical protein [Longimicrobiales bacterium]
MKTTVLICSIVLAAGCGGSPPADSPAPAPGPQPPAAPWSAARIAASAAPAPLLPEWRSAENRATCAPLAPASLGAYPNAVARAATFSGGWAVAWDLPELRSAFGVAGTGSVPDENTYDAWPHRIAWADGSTAGYGPEGGTGPRQLAYVRIPGQACLYNVWSGISREHLEQLLAQLRFVATE